jgi:ectoine hydroxylase-related dioxygenase (phytanoyl-CoA dioxygenase family)
VDDEAEACVVDVHRASPPAERAPARTERDAYVVARRAAVAACCGGGADVAARHAAVERVLFHTLPRALLDAACFEPGVQTLHLFNEQYVAKPAASRFSTFAWHRDAEEQLAMCVDVTTTPYVSVWCPLDDCSVNNGTLVVKPGLEARALGCLWQCCGVLYARLTPAARMHAAVGAAAGRLQRRRGRAHRASSRRVGWLP